MSKDCGSCFETDRTNCKQHTNLKRTDFNDDIEQVSHASMPTSALAKLTTNIKREDGWPQLELTDNFFMKLLTDVLVW